MEYKKQKTPQKANTTSQVESNPISIESAAKNKISESEINQQIADLLLDLQNDKDQNCLLNSDPILLKSQAQNLLSSKQKENIKFLGIIGKCTIPGCDVHTLTSNSEIIEHILICWKIDPAFNRAREFLCSQPSSTVGVLVYSGYFEVIQIDGSTKKLNV